MDDIYNFGSRQYDPAPAVLPNTRNITRRENLLRHLRVGLYLFGFFIFGMLKWALGLITPTPVKSIRNQVALVTGGANGLGRAICMELARRGCHVAIADVDIDGAKQTMLELKDFGVKSEAYHIDVSNYEQVLQLRDDIERDVGSVDILVNNAGLLTLVSLREGQPEDLQRIINVNLLAQFWTARVFIDGMNDRGRGHIVAISSVLGKIGTAGSVSYCATKYGVNGMMDALREELRWASSPVHITTVFPNIITTRKAFIDTLMDRANEKKDLLLLTYNTPEEVAERTVNAICRNRRNVYMSLLSQVVSFIVPFIPDVTLDSLKDAFKPKVHPYLLIEK